MSITWVQRLMRVFGIDIETCRACGGAVRIIACIEDPVVIEKILTHLDSKDPFTASGLRSPILGLTADFGSSRGRFVLIGAWSLSATATEQRFGRMELD